MNCYCLRIYNSNHGVVTEAYNEFRLVESDQVFTQEEHPCEAWKWVYENNMYLAVGISFSLAVINFICVFVFEVMVVLEKHHTYEK